MGEGVELERNIFTKVCLLRKANFRLFCESDWECLRKYSRKYKNERFHPTSPEGRGGGFFPKLDTKHGEPAFPSRDAGNYPLLFLELSNYYMKHWTSRIGKVVYTVQYMRGLAIE